MRTQHIPDTLHGELKTSYVGACHPKRILDFVSRCKSLRNLVRNPLSAGRPVIGLLAGAVYEEQMLHLLPGDILLAFTDASAKP